MKLTINTITDNQGVTSYLDADFTEEIERGAAMLDRTIPGWTEQIDTSKLQLCSGTACVLGQLSLSELLPVEIARNLGGFKYYGHLVSSMVQAGAIDLVESDNENEDCAAARYGFNLDLRPEIVDYDPVHFAVAQVRNEDYCECCESEYEDAIVPISAEAKAVWPTQEDEPEDRMAFWDALTLQWKDYLRDRLNVMELTPQEHIEEIVATVGAQPQPVFAAA